MAAIAFFAHIALDRVGASLLGPNSRGGLARESGIEVRDHHRGALASTEDRSCTAVADGEGLARLRRTVGAAAYD
jgi:hypothetical protein